MIKTLDADGFVLMSGAVMDGEQRILMLLSYALTVCSTWFRVGLG